ncbi:MAG: type IV secretion system protein, partial [Rickettsiales bacterium]|nr:type IV secretion system protein [Rickettsiales bacterium]
MKYLRLLGVALLLVIVTGGPLLASPLNPAGASCQPLITPQYGKCAEGDLQHIFSGYVCQYETIVADVFSSVYCSVKTDLETPLQILLTLFMAVFGAAILIGAVPFTQKELILALFRIALLVGFVVQSEFVVTYLYAGVIGFITSGVDVVMSASGGGTGISIYERIDTMINDFTGSGSKSGAAAGGNQCSQNILPMMVTMMFVVPPLFLLGAVVGFRLILTFLRAVVGYLFAITCIMFLIVLSPIFLGAGLFTITRRLFDKWWQYIISFAIQVVVVFGFIGLILSMGILEDFSRLKNLSVPYSGGTWQADARVNYDNWCTMCAQPAPDFQSCTDPTPIPPTGLTGFLNITRLLAMESLNLLLLAFLIDAVLKLAPSVAVSLGLVRTAPEVSGSMFNSITGVSSLQSAGRSASQAFMQNRGGLPGRAGASISSGYSAFFRGGNGSPGVIGEIFRDMLGG